MNEVNLFLAKDGKWVTNRTMIESLLSIGANQCDTLFIHSSLSFGQPNPQLKKKELLAELLNVIDNLNVKTVCMPTFTFSFCNGIGYNPEKSASRMGVLNEFFRKQEGVLRSVDPLMSVALKGEDTDLVRKIGHESCGANSTYDMLRHRDNVKFLFLGPKIGECMTYMHYLEWLYGVEYRYDRTFRGEVTIDGQTKVEEYTLFCRYNGVTPSTGTFVFEQKMYDNNEAFITNVGDGTISIVEEKQAAKRYKAFLDENPYAFVDLEGNVLTKDKTYNPVGEVVAM